MAQDTPPEVPRRPVRGAALWRKPHYLLKKAGQVVATLSIIGLLFNRYGRHWGVIADHLIEQTRVIDPKTFTFHVSAYARCGGLIHYLGSTLPRDIPPATVASLRHAWAFCRNDALAAARPADWGWFVLRLPGGFLYALSMAYKEGGFVTLFVCVVAALAVLMFVMGGPGADRGSRLLVLPAWGAFLFGLAAAAVKYFLLALFYVFSALLAVCVSGFVAAWVIIELLEKTFHVIHNAEDIYNLFHAKLAQLLGAFASIFGHPPK